MSISKMFTLGVVTASTGGQINQILAHNINPGLETILFRSDGQVNPQFAAVMFQQPILTFTSAAITRALTAAGLLSGLAAAGTAVDFYLHKYAQGGTRASGSNHLKVSAGYGLLCPRTIEATHGAIATISYEMAVRSSDGTTAPLAVAAAQAMSAINAPDQLFTAGPVKINGTALEGVKRITIDSGLSLVIQGGDGNAYPTFIAIQESRPVITVRSTHADFPTESGMGLYVAQGATDSVVFLRKVAQNGLRVPDATTEHISFTMDDGLVTIRDISSDNENMDGSAIEVVIEPAYDGTNAILVVSTASAIT